MSEFIAWWKELTPGGVGVWTCVALVAVALIRQGPINRKLQQEREGNLLRERAIEMKGMRRRIIELEVEQRADRHTIGNLEQALEMFLSLVEAQPDRAQEWAKKVRGQIKDKSEAIAVEKAAIFHAKITAAEADEVGEAENRKEGS